MTKKLSVCPRCHKPDHLIEVKMSFGSFYECHTCKECFLEPEEIEVEVETWNLSDHIAITFEQCDAFWGGEPRNLRIIIPDDIDVVELKQAFIKLAEIAVDESCRLSHEMWCAC